MKLFSRSKDSREDETVKSFETLYTDYIKRLNDTSNATDRRVADALRNYAQAARDNGQAAMDAAQKAADDARNDYVEAVREAWDTSQKDYAAAYEEYLKAFREALGKTDGAEISPAAMSIITMSGSAAANCAASCIGNWQLLAWSGVPPSVFTADKESTDNK